MAQKKFHDGGFNSRPVRPCPYFSPLCCFWRGNGSPTGFSGEKWSIKERVILYKKNVFRPMKNKANKQHVRVGTDASARIQRSGYTVVCIMSGWAVSSSVALSQQSVLPFSSELWILSRVFLMRRAVSRAEGFWYQHSFISFTRADRVCDHTKTQTFVFSSWWGSVSYNY